MRILSAVLGNFYFGYALAYYGITQNSIVYILGYQQSQFKSILDGIVNAVLPIGAALGAYKSGFRSTFIYCDIIGIINVLLSFFLNFPFLLATRFIYGVIVGINSALNPQFVKQVSPQNLSGIYGVFCNAGLLSGLTIAFILSWVCLQSDVNSYSINTNYGIVGFNNWRIIFGFPSVFCFLRLIGFIFFFQTKLASEYVQEGDIQNAKLALKQTFHDQYHEQILKSLMHLQDKSIQQVFNLFQYKQFQLLKEQSFNDPLNPIYRKRLQIGCVLALLYQWCGINAINFYSATVFKQVANGNSNVINLITILDGVITLILCLFSGLVINKFGRRKIYLIGNGVCAISLTMVTVFISLLNSLEDQNYYQLQKILQYIILIFVFSFLIAFCMSIGPVFWIYIADILPPDGISIVVLLSWLSLALLAQIFPIVAEKTNIAYCFGAFAVFSIIGEIFIFNEIKETKGVMKDQINQLFGGQLDDGLNSSNRDFIENNLNIEKAIELKELPNILNDDRAHVSLQQKMIV